MIVLVAILYSLNTLFVHGTTLEPFRLAGYSTQPEKRNAKHCRYRDNCNSLGASREIERNEPYSRIPTKHAEERKPSAHKDDSRTRNLERKGEIGIAKSGYPVQKRLDNNDSSHCA